MLKRTPFHSRVEPLCVSYDWRRWAGYVVASKYELTHDREYAAIRNAAALIDVSPLFKYMVTGRDAARFLDRLMTRDIANCPAGRVLYAVWCDERGQVIEDGTVTRLAEDSFRVTAAEPNLRWFLDNVGHLDVDIRDVSAEMAALAVQGPRAREVLLRVTDPAVASLKYFRAMEATMAGRPVSISRTGYTGDLGYEIWLAAEDAPLIWDTLMVAGQDFGLLPAGMLALDIARIEAGLLLIDVDYTPANKAFIDAQKSSPYELGLGWAVDLARPGYFIGRRALEAEKQRGSEWQFVGLQVDWDTLEQTYARLKLPPQVPSTAWRMSVPLYTRPGREAGYATSGCFSPLLKRYIVLASVYTRHAAPDTQLEMEITVQHMRRRVAAQVVETPFFNPLRKRK